MTISLRMRYALYRGTMNIRGSAIVKRYSVWGILLIAGTIVAVFSMRSNSEEESTVTSTNLEVATFAGGCFWCMEHPFDELEGVRSTTSGYTGGHKVNPTYQEVSAGGTGHAEAVQVVYDPKIIRYEKLLYVFWHNIDPTVKNRQFCDSGSQYQAAIFTHNDEQIRLAEVSKAALSKAKTFKEPIITPIIPASTFYPAEEYHQNFYKKNSVHYKLYRLSCGRDRRLKELWG